ncbi:SPOC domain-like protein [Westerdykella ornata]|uniref:ATP-dependent DNA helicase II subunit 2 n=1 Tax=Westerdykella ornata TaxID=318751 RepID=A0A6A6JIP8_WESOR|nr:SPOC domain-like protein [Westerdykella ornata]KAF2275526.1 SPOC domain-like protein [Westerdykella ornata]
MAQKEATVFIVDLGHTMGRKEHGRDKTNLEWAMQFVWDKILTTVVTGRKTCFMSVMGVRTDETELNGLLEEDAEGYENIRVIKGLKQFLLKDIREVQAQIKPSRTNDGDIISAITVAVHMIDKGTRGKTGDLLKFDRRIYVVTDGRGAIDTAGLDDIAERLSKEMQIDLTLLGVDFDDPENGYKEEDKDPHKAENEKVLREFVEKQCGGVFGTVAEAVEQLEVPRVKDTRPVPSYRGTLTLGDSEKYEGTLTIDVERYPCTMVAKPPTASSFVHRTELAGAGASTQSSTTLPLEEADGDGQLAAVRSQRVYQVEDPNAPGAKMNVEQDELERGFEYGRTAVHISEAESNVVKLETQQCLDIIGFVAAEKFERYLAMSRTNYIFPMKGNRAAQLALSSFIHALYEAECYAIARLVPKDDKPPTVVLLVPRIELDLECLIDVELPFEEDMRRYKFPPLDKKLTVTGKVLTEHRDLPTSDLMQAMSDYVDAMDLSTFDRDDEGNPAEYMRFEDTYSPLLHRVNQVIRWRAMNATSDGLPDPPPILTKFSVPPPDLVEKTDRQLSTLRSVADVKKVPPKQKGRGKRRREDRDKPLSGLDVDELLGNPKRIKIDPQNLIPSFKQALLATDDLESIQSAATAMGSEIRKIIRESVGETGYARALEAMRVMRDELAELEEPGIWNGFVRDLKRELLEGKLGGDRREMWWRVRGSRYGLIDRKRSFASEVSEEEARKFFES